MQLFCFTFAGGTAAFFNQLENACNSLIDNNNLEFIKLEYSGHGNRMREPLYSDFRQISTDLYSIIRDRNKGQDYALLGYSMGSFAALDMYKYIKEKDEINLPGHLFFAAHAPGSLIDFTGMSESDIDKITKERTIEFGAIPDNLINNKTFWRTYLPIYRADYQMISRYALEGIDTIVDAPLTVFYSNDDTPVSEIKCWQKYCSKKVEMICYEGSHFFINEHYMEMAKVIIERLGL